eukprot:3210844-Prymnesium_polylepis.2
MPPHVSVLRSARFRPLDPATPRPLAPARPPARRPVRSCSSASGIGAQIEAERKSRAEGDEQLAAQLKTEIDAVNARIRECSTICESAPDPHRESHGAHHIASRRSPAPFTQCLSAGRSCHALQRKPRTCSCSTRSRPESRRTHPHHSRAQRLRRARPTPPIR